jgi:hypothetical protein
VTRFSVQWHKKFAFPLIAAVIVLLAISVAFLVGTDGAMGGLALGAAIGIVYWTVSALLEASLAFANNAVVLKEIGQDIHFASVTPTGSPSPFRCHSRHPRTAQARMPDNSRCNFSGSSLSRSSPCCLGPNLDQRAKKLDLSPPC